MGRISVLDKKVEGKCSYEITVTVKVEDDEDCIVIITIPEGSGVTFADTGENTTEIDIDCTIQEPQTISFTLECDEPERMVLRATYTLKDGSDSDFNRIILSV